MASFVEATDHLLIRFRLHQDIAVGQKEWRRAGELLGHFRRLSGSVLHHLTAIADLRLPFGTVAKITLNHLSPKTGHDENLANSSGHNALQNVLENGLALYP